MDNFFLHFEYQKFILAFLYVILSFMIFHFISTSLKIKKYFIGKFGIENYSVFQTTFNRLFAIFIYGIIPFLIIVFNKNIKIIEFGLNFKNIYTNIGWILLLCLLTIIINYINKATSDNLKLYPQIRKKEWDVQLLIFSALGWIAYLCAYEFLFRGFFLYTCFYAFGTWPAIIINFVIYSLIHVPKGRKEAIGAIPLGFVLCLLTLQSGNIFAALLIHITMALSNEWLTLTIHPDIHLVRKKS